MGVVVKAHCPCGYESGELFTGPGFRSDSCTELARCEHCWEIVLVPCDSVRPHCPNCGHKVQANSMNAVRISDSESPTFICPRCGNPTMELDLVGMWD
jgi:hypothetical protein